MKKFICLALTIILMCALIGCSKSANEDDDFDRLIRVYSDFNNIIYVDTETKVMYWLRLGVHACDIQVMVDANGKPLLWEGR